jgi:hypothetical protein
VPPNGPAIKGGCVTRREHRQDPETSERKWSRCKEGMARVFAVMVNFNCVLGAIAVQTKVRPLLSQGTEFGSKALVQYRGTNMIEATFESRCRGMRAGS